MTFFPVTRISAIWHACEPIARKIEMTRPRLYGRRNERSRPNVRRYGTALIPLNVATESYAPAHGDGAGRQPRRALRTAARAGRGRGGGVLAAGGSVGAGARLRHRADHAPARTPRLLRDGGGRVGCDARARPGCGDGRGANRGARSWSAV